MTIIYEMFLSNRINRAQNTLEARVQKNFCKRTRLLPTLSDIRKKICVQSLGILTYFTYRSRSLQKFCRLCYNNMLSLQNKRYTLTLSSLVNYSNHVNCILIQQPAG